MATVITTTFKLRRGQSSLWESKNPILAEGEPGYALDTKTLKIGDGVKTWNELDAISGASISISPDGKSLAYDKAGDLCVIGIESAQVGQIPMRNKNGGISWMSLSPVAISGAIDDLTQRETIRIYCGSASDLVEEM